MSAASILLGFACLGAVYAVLYVYPLVFKKRPEFTRLQIEEWTDRTLAQVAMHDILVVTLCLAGNELELTDILSSAAHGQHLRPN